MQIVRARDFEQPFGMPEYGFRKKPAPGKNRQRVAERDEVSRNCLRGVRNFRDQPLQVVNAVIPIRQRTEQCLYDTEYIWRQRLKSGTKSAVSAMRCVSRNSSSSSRLGPTRFDVESSGTSSIIQLTGAGVCYSILSGAIRRMRTKYVAGCAVALLVVLAGCSDTLGATRRHLGSRSKGDQRRRNPVGGRLGREGRGQNRRPLCWTTRHCWFRMLRSPKGKMRSGQLCRVTSKYLTICR